MHKDRRRRGKERDKTFFLPCRLRLLLHSFLTSKKIYFVDSNIEGALLPQRAFMKRSFIVIYLIVFSLFFPIPSPSTHRTNKKKQNFSSQQCFWAWFRCRSCRWCWECDDGGEGIYASTKERNLFVLRGEEKECEEFSCIFLLFCTFRIEFHPINQMLQMRWLF